MGLNYNKIFQIFSTDNMSGEVNTTTTYNELRDHPIYFLGMYKKMMNYKPLENEKILAFLDKQKLDINPDEMRNAGIRIAYDKAYVYLSEFNINDPYHLEHLEYYKNDDLIDTLNKGIYYFESTSEFEKCAFIKKILDKAKI